jgi:hypothetical protein
VTAAALESTAGGVEANFEKITQANTMIGVHDKKIEDLIGTIAVPIFIRRTFTKSHYIKGFLLRFS